MFSWLLVMDVIDNQQPDPLTYWTVEYPKINYKNLHSCWWTHFVGICTLMQTFNYHPSTRTKLGNEYIRIRTKFNSQQQKNKSWGRKLWKMQIRRYSMANRMLRTCLGTPLVPLSWAWKPHTSERSSLRRMTSNVFKNVPAGDREDVGHLSCRHWKQKLHTFLSR